MSLPAQLCIMGWSLHEVSRKSMLVVDGVDLMRDHPMLHLFRGCMQARGRAPGPKQDQHMPAWTHSICPVLPMRVSLWFASVCVSVCQCVCFCLVCWSQTKACRGLSCLSVALALCRFEWLSQSQAPAAPAAAVVLVLSPSQQHGCKGYSLCAQLCC